MSSLTQTADAVEAALLICGLRSTIKRHIHANLQNYFMIKRVYTCQEMGEGGVVWDTWGPPNDLVWWAFDSVGVWWLWSVEIGNDGGEEFWDKVFSLSLSVFLPLSLADQLASCLHFLINLSLLIIIIILYLIIVFLFIFYFLTFETFGVSSSEYQPSQSRKPNSCVYILVHYLHENIYEWIKLFQ